MAALTVNFCCLKLFSWPPSLRPSSYRDATRKDATEHSAEEYASAFPPPPPREIVSNRDAYKAKVLKHKPMVINKAPVSNSLVALYRLYEFFVLDYVFGYRSQLEFFWRTSEWRLLDLPDPEDDSPARYAFLASMVQMMVEVYNKKIAYGSCRDAPAILTPEEVETMQSRPDSERTWERAPGWAERVQPLADILIIPTYDGRMPDNVEDKRAEPHFRSKNILLWYPHVDFT